VHSRSAQNDGVNLVSMHKENYYQNNCGMFVIRERTAH